MAPTAMILDRDETAETRQAERKAQARQTVPKKTGPYSQLPALPVHRPAKQTLRRCDGSIQNTPDLRPAEAAGADDGGGVLTAPRDSQIVAPVEKGVPLLLNLQCPGFRCGATSD